MKPGNLKQYIKIYKDFVDPKICKGAVKSLKKVQWHEHQFHNAATNSFVSYDHELAISNDNIKEKEALNSAVWHALEKYIVKDFAEFHRWFNSWNGHTFVRFNKYDPTTEMKIHCDHIHSMFDGERKGVPVLTVLGGLNDDYEGGELVMWEDQVIDLPAGAVMVFPSNFLYPHEVRPVKSGVRYSYVSWAW
jgi:predicted 2-oxoglutarate/Fe(II)-dependent dioxygenase YbiX